MRSAAARDVTALIARLGVAVDPDLMLRAVTHRSWSAEHAGATHNERLELIGDAVLDLVIAAELAARDTLADEGVLSRRRAQLVRESTLAEVARDIGLGAELRLGRGEIGSGGADKDSLLADALEAVVGAAFLTSGYEDAAALVLRLFDPLLADVAADDAELGARGPIDAKTALQERLAAAGLPAPEYRTTQDGPDHAPTFLAEVLVAGAVRGTGVGGSKKLATQAAAEQALRSEALG